MSGEAPNLLERIANALFTDAAPDVTPVYEHTWPLSTGATVLIVFALAAGVFWIYSRERTTAPNWMRWAMAALRSAALAVAIFMMYGWLLRQHRVDLPDLALVIDVSKSMETADAYQDSQRQARIRKLSEADDGEAPRMELVKKAFLAKRRPLLDELSRRFNLKLYFVADSAMTQTGDPKATLQDAVADGEHSRLGDGLRSVLEFQRGRPTSSIVLVTDGVTTAGQSLASAAQYARRTSMPVFAIGVGDDETPKDVRLGDLLAEEVAFAGDLIHFDFKVSAAGYEGKPIRIRLTKGESGETLDEKTITLGADDTARSVRLSHREEEQGEFLFVVKADELPKETNKQNNLLSRRIRVREETIRVLLVQEYPSFEFRFLKTMLSRRLKRESDTEKLVELTTILQDADLDYAELDATAERVFPVSQDQLYGYDVLIFGDVDRSQFSDSTLRLIADFVRERGGGVVFLAGPRHTPMDYRDTPIAELLPFELTTAIAPSAEAVLDETFAFEAKATRLGMSSPQLQVGDNLPESLGAWSAMPEMHFLVETPDLRPGARVLLEHKTKVGPSGSPLPIVSMQFVGAGKVIFHGTDESYRWARHPDGEKYYNRYWLQTIRYLSRSRLLGGDRGAELVTDRREYRRGDPVALRVRFLDERKAPPQDDGVVVVVEQQGGKRRQVRMSRSNIGRGAFEATVSGLVDGRYRAWLATPTLEGQPPSSEFEVTAPLGEQARIQMDRAELTRVAKATGGKFYVLEDLNRLLDDLPVGRRVRIESMPPEPIWNSNYLAALLVGLLVGEWLLRKRAGML